MNDIKKTTILKVVVGSQGHGLATTDSDTDYRGVFVVPTTEILSLGKSIEQTSWIEGKVDDTSWEIGKFLFLATKCNPTILEVFLAPPVWRIDQGGNNGWEASEANFYGEQLRELFPYVWNSVDVRNAFVGYGLNQRKKFFDNKDKRAPKYAAAYLRTLYNAWEFLSTGKFTVKIADTEVGEQVRKFKQGEYTMGEVIQACVDWEVKVNKAFESSPKHEADLRPVNEYLLKVRKEFWI